MKGNRIVSIYAYVSLAISVVMMLLWCCNVGGFTVVSLDSFVGVIVALLAIVVTLAIAWQIYNAVELKQKIEELNLIKSQFGEQEKSLNQIAYRFNHHIGHIMGERDLRDGNVVEAFRSYIFSLENAMLLSKPINIEILINKMEEAVALIKDKQYYEAVFYDMVIESDKTIRSLENYNYIRVRYEKTFNKFMSEVKRYEE